MTRIRFTVPGNQKDPAGNPIPYTRMIRDKFRKDSVDYLEWKEYVRASFDRSSIWEVDGYEPAATYKPIYGPDLPYPTIVKEGQDIAVHAFIYWADKRHGDGDNILKGIMDALFRNDKCVWAGSFESRLSPNKTGRVDVLLELELQP